MRGGFSKKNHVNSPSPLGPWWLAQRCWDDWIWQQPSSCKTKLSCQQPQGSTTTLAMICFQRTIQKIKMKHTKVGDPVQNAIGNWCRASKPKYSAGSQHLRLLIYKENETLLRQLSAGTQSHMNTWVVMDVRSFAKRLKKLRFTCTWTGPTAEFIHPPIHNLWGRDHTFLHQPYHKFWHNAHRVTWDKFDHFSWWFVLPPPHKRIIPACQLVTNCLQ